MLVYSWTTVDGDRFKSGLKGKWLEVKKQFALEPFYSDFRCSLYAGFRGTQFRGGQKVDPVYQCKS